MIKILTTSILILLLILPIAAFAHTPSSSYLSLSKENNTLQLQWDIALRDLEYVIGLDSNLDQQITWQEVKAKQADITAYAYSHLTMQRNQQPCSANNTALKVNKHADGMYATLLSQAKCQSKVGEISLHYSLLFAEDPNHRGIIIDQRDKQSSQPLIASPDEPLVTLSKGNNPLQNFLTFIQQGIWHIWIGLDHILFIITLMLPVVLLYKNKQWQSVKHFKPALFDLFKVITAFTLAHSITLSLATLEIVNLPSRWVESAIALSVVLLAINNIKPVITHARWSIAFIFGLIHGFGFASVLGDLNLSEGSLILSLLGFNIGVEIGQSLILLLLFPTAYWLRDTVFYRAYILRGGSLAISMLASVWLVQRALF